MANNRHTHLFKENLQRYSIISLLLRLVSIPAGLLTAQFLADLTTAATGADVPAVAKYGIFLISVVVAHQVFTILTDIPYKKAVSNAVQACKVKLYTQFLLRPTYQLYECTYGDTMENFKTDFPSVTNRYLKLYPDLLEGSFTIIAYFIFIALQSPLLAGILLLISIIQLLPPIIVKKYMETNYESCKKIEAEITDYVVEGYRGFADIKMYNLKNWYINGLKALHKRYLPIGYATNLSSRGEQAMNSLVSNILRYGSYGIIGLCVLYGQSSLEVGIKAIALSQSLYAAVRSVFAVIPDFGIANKAEKHISDWFEYTDEETHSLIQSHVCLNNINYSYGEHSILHDLTAEIDCSKINIIHGANGAGKSTLLKLIAGLLKNDGGLIKIGDINTEKLTPKDYTHNVFYLPQDDANFDFSASELYEMVIPDEKQLVVSIAHAFDLSDNLLINEKINELSGGERKKVFLALAFALKPAFLMLDEPTNALDEKGKTMLCQYLSERNSGAVIITHDIVLNNIADIIYRFCNGGLTVETDK